jgi:chitin disaccharide deacetylase
VTGQLIVNADDLGVTRGATLGVVRGHLEGVVTSASLCVTTPFYRDAVDTCVRRCPDLGVGLHLALTVGSPVGDPARVPLLVDARGRFRWRFGSLLYGVTVRRRADLLAQIRLEVAAQFARLADDGIRPDHVNGERHVHLIPGIFECVVDAARRHGVRFVRAGRENGYAFLSPPHLPLLLANGGFAKVAVLNRLAARARKRMGAGVGTADRVVSYLYTGRMDVILSSVLRNASPGVTEMMLHPGVPEANGTIDLGNDAMERYLMSQDRQRELDASIAARSQKTAWRLTNYRELARHA